MMLFYFYPPGPADEIAARSMRAGLDMMMTFAVFGQPVAVHLSCASMALVRAGSTDTAMQWHSLEDWGLVQATCDAPGGDSRCAGLPGERTGTTLSTPSAPPCLQTKAQPFSALREISEIERCALFRSADSILIW